MKRNAVAITIWISTTIAICYALYLIQEPVVLLAYLFPFFATNSFHIELEESTK